MQRDLRAIFDGAIGGAIGTAGMSALMLAAGKAGLMGEQPPDKIAGAALDALGVHEPDGKVQDAVATALHFVFGTGAGVLFGVLHRRLPFRAPGALYGMLFAAIIWGTSYQGWIPGLGIMPLASEDRPDRPRVMLLVHLVYGVILGIIVARRQPSPEPRAEGEDDLALAAGY